MSKKQKKLSFTSQRTLCHNYEEQEFTLGLEKIRPLF